MEFDENQLRNLLAQLVTKVDTCELTVREALTQAMNHVLKEWQEANEDASTCCLCDPHADWDGLAHLIKVTEVKPVQRVGMLKV